MGSLRVIALGEITGVPGAHLDCECGQDDCPKRGGSTDSNGSAETPADADDAAAWDDLLPAPADADAPDVELVEPVVEPEIPDPMDERRRMRCRWRSGEPGGAECARVDGGH